MNPKNSEDLFNKIRSQFSNIRLGDENGAATADPSNAVSSNSRKTQTRLVV